MNFLICSHFQYSIYLFLFWVNCFVFVDKRLIIALHQCSRSNQTSNRSTSEEKWKLENWKPWTNSGFEYKFKHALACLHLLEDDDVCQRKLWRVLKTLMRQDMWREGFLWHSSNLLPDSVEKYVISQCSNPREESIFVFL